MFLGGISWTLKADLSYKMYSGKQSSGVNVSIQAFVLQAQQTDGDSFSLYQNKVFCSPLYQPSSSLVF